MRAIKNRPGLIAFKKLPEQEQKRLLFDIEAALCANARRGKSIQDLEIEVAILLNVATNVVKEVTATKQFKNKVAYKLM